MNMFEEIDKKEEELNTDKLKGKAKQITNKYNKYQIIAFVILCIGIIIGIISGSVNSSNESITNYSYSEYSTTTFNTNLLLIIWGISFLTALSIYWMGEVVTILKSIEDKVSNNNKKK